MKCHRSRIFKILIFKGNFVDVTGIEPATCAYRKLHSAFSTQWTMLRPYRLVSTLSVSSSRKSLISKVLAPDNIFGRDKQKTLWALALSSRLKAPLLHPMHPKKLTQLQ